MLIYFTMFNLIYFTTCSSIFFKYGNIISIPDLLVFVISTLLTLFAFGKFFMDPDPFDYFRYSFRYAGTSRFY